MSTAEMRIEIRREKIFFLSIEAISEYYPDIVANDNKNIFNSNGLLRIDEFD
jgi:hypothetical protein